jgi:hypothetical protein
MNVKELIEKLQKENQESLVVVNGYEEGFTELHSVKQILIKQDPDHKHWEGEYDNYPVEECNIHAILLPRS